MSKLEHLAYKMVPAGHEAGDSKRKYTNKLNKKLQRAFEEWVKAVNGEFAKPQTLIPYTAAKREAGELTKGIRCTVEEAHSLYLINQDRFPAIGLFGYFLSALYNEIPDKTIVFDLKTRLYHVGNELKKGKILVNTGTNDDFGEDSQGTIINHGIVTYTLGAGASGLLINYKRCKSLGGHDISGETKGVVINLGKAEAVSSGSLGINYGKTFYVETNSKNPGTLLNLNPQPVRFLYNKNLWKNSYDRTNAGTYELSE